MMIMIKRKKWKGYEEEKEEEKVGEKKDKEKGRKKGGEVMTKITI